MPDRTEKRLVIALPVRVYGIGSDGKPFNQEAHTLDITRDGARIDGLPKLTGGETVGVQYGEEKSRYKVVWASDPDEHHHCQIGVQTVQIGPAPWHKILEASPERDRWVDPEHSRDPFAGPVIHHDHTAPPGPPSSNITDRVAQATDELQTIEKMIESGEVDGRILQDFREAVNHVRQTSWAVQRWLELRDKHQDPYSAVDLLILERIRCATKLNRELGHDVESAEVDHETEGIKPLQTEVMSLAEILLRILGNPK